MILMEKMLQVMERVLPSLVMPTVRMWLVMVSWMPTARELYWVGGANGESAVGGAPMLVSLVMPTVRVPQGMQWWMVSPAIL